MAGIQEGAVGRDDPQAIRIAIRGQSHVPSTGFERLGQFPQVAGDRLRGLSAEERIRLGMQRVDAAPAAAQQLFDQAAAGSMHRIDKRLHAAAPNRFQIDDGTDAVEKPRQKINPANQSALLRLRE